MCTTRTYTRQHAEYDTLRYLLRLYDEGIRAAELDDARAFALEQWDEWPDATACPEHAKAGWTVPGMLHRRRLRREQRRYRWWLEARRKRLGID
jgi:hypothetical protein